MIEQQIGQGLFERGVLGLMLLISLVFIFYMWRELNERHSTTVKLVEKNTEALSGMKESIAHLSEFLRGRFNP